MSPRTSRTLPTIEPVVPVLGSPPLNDPNWLYEPKFDGWRGILYLSGREGYIRSKRGNLLRRFAELAERVRSELSVRDAILDGEVVALDDEGRMDFRALQHGRGWLHYVVFDVLWLNGKDMRPQQLSRRKRRLEGLIPGSTPTLSRVLAVEERGRELFDAAQRLDLEGIVAKRKRDPYSRQTVWYKVKNPAYTQADGRGDLFSKPR
jgi:bifunctional non-homologous end joining protein LigD